MQLKVPASILPIAEVCPGVLDLVVREPIMADSADALWREAFALGAAPPTAHSIDAYAKTKARLTDMISVDVEEAIANYQMATRTGDVIPSAHRFRFAVDSDLEGRIPAQGALAITAVVECAWVVSGGAPDSPTARAVVVQHELARLEPPSPMELDLVFAGIAMATLYGVDRMQLGRCVHSPGKGAVYKWSPILIEKDMDALWARIAAIFKRPRALVMSDLCERCPMRRACPQWLLPVVHGAGNAYKLLTAADGPLAHNDVAIVRRFAKAMREAADLADGQLRAMKREGVT